jgi:5-(carboxyamino)imidazole ribonucleotide mutase
LDSLLSIAQMPRGVPVATVAINGATNAGLLAARILGLNDTTLSDALEEYRLELADQAGTQDRDLPRN